MKHLLLLLNERSCDPPVETAAAVNICNVLPVTPQLLHLGREYPKGADYFRDRLRAAFAKNRDVQDPERIKEMIARGEFVARELEALYYLRKYRAMKKRYYEE